MDESSKERAASMALAEIESLYTATDSGWLEARLRGIYSLVKEATRQPEKAPWSDSGKSNGTLPGTEERRSGRFTDAPVLRWRREVDHWRVASHDSGQLLATVSDYNDRHVTPHGWCPAEFEYIVKAVGCRHLM